MQLKLNNFKLNTRLQYYIHTYTHTKKYAFIISIFILIYIEYIHTKYLILYSYGEYGTIEFYYTVKSKCKTEIMYEFFSFSNNNFNTITALDCSYNSNFICAMNQLWRKLFNSIFCILIQLYADIIIKNYKCLLIWYIALFAAFKN